MGFSTKMVKLLSAFGFVACFAVVLAAVFNPPSLGTLQAQETPTRNCQYLQVAIDEGYGVSARENKLVCKTEARLGGDQR